MDPRRDGEVEGVITTESTDTIRSPFNGGLPGSKVRKITGAFQIACGAIEAALAIVVICIPLQKTNRIYYTFLGHYVRYHEFTTVYDESDKIGWGIWNGLFAIVTGCLGLYSKRSKYKVAAYMATSIVATISSISCLIWAALSIHETIDESAQYVNKNAGTSLVMYAILSFAFAVQMVMSILGASFTCGALSSRPESNQPLAVYYSVAHPQLQQAEATPVVFFYQASVPPPEYNTSVNSINQPIFPNQDELKSL